MRDTNRGRIYTAEQAVRKSLKSARGTTASKLQDVTFASNDEAQAWLDDHLRPAHETAAQRNELKVGVFTKPDVKGKPASTSTYYALGSKHCPGTIPSIGLARDWGYTGLVLAHEYAHHLVRLIGDHNNVVRAVPDHGSEFARVFIDVVKEAYDAPVAAALEASYQQHKVLYEPAQQRAAAHKQVLRLRSDTLLANERARVIPMSLVIFAADPDDYLGVTYQRTYDKLDLASTRTHELHFRDGNDLVVAWRQLRYIEAPMVRWR